MQTMTLIEVANCQLTAQMYKEIKPQLILSFCDFAISEFLMSAMIGWWYLSSKLPVMAEHQQTGCERRAFHLPFKMYS